MLVAALLSLVATVAIPLMTKAVIDGPVRHQDQQRLWVLGTAAMAVGISEAVLWFIRRWLVARATMGVEADIRKDLYARLQILPMSFHGRWQSGQLLSRIMNDLSTIRRFLSFGLLFLLLNIIQIIVVTGDPAGDVLAARCRRAWCRSCRSPRRCCTSSGSTPGCRGWRRTSPATSQRTSRSRRSGCGWSRRSAARSTSTTGSTSGSPTSTTPQVSKVVGVGEVLDAARGHPEPHADHRARASARTPRATGYVTMGTLVAFITMMLSLVWPIASLGFLLSMTQESMTAANRDRRDLRCATRNHRRPATRRRRAVAGSNSSTSASASPMPATTGRCGTSTSPSNPARRWPSSGRPDRASRCSRRCCRGCTTSPRARSASTASDIRELSLPALRQAVATAFEDPTLFSMSVAENLALGRPDDRDRRAAGAGRRGRRRAVRLRPAVRARHPHRRAGHEPVRRSAATAFAGARHCSPRRRSWCSTTPCRRSTCTPRPSSTEALRRVLRLGHRRRRRAPGVDGAARRPGRAARGRHHHPRRHACRIARRRAGIPLPARRRRRTRRRRRAQLRLGAGRGPQQARPGCIRSRRRPTPHEDGPRCATAEAEGR